MSRFLAGALCLAFAAPCRAAVPGRVACQRRSHAISIDGQDSDWRTVAASEHQNLLLSCLNDRSFLYLYVSPADKPTEAQLTGLDGWTFTVWFGTAAPTRRLGLNFRFKPRSSGRGGWSAQSPGLPAGFVSQFGGSTGNPWPGGRQSPDAAARLESIEILSTDELGRPRDPAPLSRVFPGGIQAKLGDSQGGVFYEMQIPLRLIYGNPKGLPRTIALGFETSSGSAERDFPSLSSAAFGVNYDEGSSQSYGGSGGGRRGRRGGGGASGRGSVSLQARPPLHLWLSAALAPFPAARPPALDESPKL